MDILDKYTEFAKVNDIWTNIIHDKKALFEFVNNVVMNMNKTDDNNNNGFGIMLQDLSNLWVLISKKDFPFHKITSSQKKSINLMKAENSFVLGYIWLCPWTLENKENKSYHFINFIDSRISGLNIAEYMVDKYKDKYEKEDNVISLLPYEIMYGAEKYWKKHFIKNYNIKNKNDLHQMINDYNLDTGDRYRIGDIKWDNLFEEFEQ